MAILTEEEFIRQADIKHLNYRKVPEDHDSLSDELDKYPLQWDTDWWVTGDGHWRLYWPHKDVFLYPRSPLAKEYFRKHFTEETAFGKDYAYHSPLAIVHILERFKQRTNES